MKYPTLYVDLTHALAQLIIFATDDRYRIGNRWLRAFALAVSQRNEKAMLACLDELDKLRTRHPGMPLPLARFQAYARCELAAARRKAMTSITLREFDRLLREDDELPAEMADLVGNVIVETFAATVTFEVNSNTLANRAARHSPTFKRLGPVRQRSVKSILTMLVFFFTVPSDDPEEK